MDLLKFGEITFDQSGFTCRGRHVAWGTVVSVEERADGGSSDTSGNRHLNICLNGAEKIVLKLEDFDGNGFLALRVLLKEILPDRVKLDGPRYLKFGAEECEFTILIAEFLHRLGRLEESKFAYKHAISVIEYYHNGSHSLLCEPLSALALLEKKSNPAESARMLARAQAISKASKGDRSLLSNFLKPASEKKKLKDKLEEAVAEFRKVKGREPKAVEKARILQEVEASME